MKTKIRRYSRSALSVLLTLCMIASCFTVAVIGTDAAQVQSDSTGGTKYFHHAPNRDGIKTAGGDTMPYKMNVSAGTLMVAVNEYGSANQSNEITSVVLPSGVYDNYDSEFDGWHYRTLYFGSDMNNVTFTFNNGVLTVSAESRYLLTRDGTSGNWTNLGSVTLTNNQASKTITKDVTADSYYQFVLVKSVDSLSSADDAFVGNAIGVYGDANLRPNSVADGTKHYAQIQPTTPAKMNITIEVDASQMSYTFHDELLYSTTVAAGVGGKVTVNSTTIESDDDPPSKTFDVGAVGMTVTAEPKSGYAFAYWESGDTGSNAAYVTQPNSASTTLKARANGGTVTAKFRKSLGSRSIYFDTTGTNAASWTSVYAYAEYTDPLTSELIKPLGDFPGTKMSSAATGVYVASVDWSTTKLEFSDGTSANKYTTTHNGLTNGSDTVPQKGVTADESKNLYTASNQTWGTYSRPANQKTFTLDVDSQYKDMIYTGVKATMFDYYTDNEINASGGPVANWYTAIDAASDGWHGGIGNREPTKIFNQSLSEYAGQNGVEYPMYFGSFYVGSYNDPGYYHSDTAHYGNLINDSNSLGGGHKGLTGLAAATEGSSVNHSGGSIPMAMFDRDWLTSRSAKSGSTSNQVVLDIGSTTWGDENARIYVALRRNSNGNWWDEYWLELTNTSGTLYTAAIPSGFEYQNLALVHFFRYNPNASQPTTGLMTSSGAAQANWDQTRWATIKDIAPPANSSSTFKLTGYSAGSWISDWTSSGYTYTGPLAQIFDGNFPVRKMIKKEGSNNVDYYTFNTSVEGDSYDGSYNSGNHVDTVYFTQSTKYTDSPVMKYTNVGTECVDNPYGGGPGFFPFDQRNQEGIGTTAKDMAFGMKLTVEFTLGKDGKTKDAIDKTTLVDQKFNFTGDDDLWVYVDGNLVLDLGGDHEKSSGTINFAGGVNKATVSFDPAPDTSIAAPSYEVAVRNQDTTEIHTMEIYYMERGHHQSNLKFGFSITPLGSVYTAEKEVDYSNVNSAMLTDVTNAVDNQAFTFTHKTSETENGTYTASAEKTYKRYYNDNVVFSGDTDGQGRFDLNNGEYSVFTEQFPAGVWFDVDESEDSPYNFDVDSVITDEVMNTTITPNNAGNYLFKTTKANAGPLDPTKIKQTFTNTVKTKDVTITKKIAGAYAPSENFTIQVKFKLPSASGDPAVYANMHFKRDGVDDQLDAQGKTTIHQNEKLVFEGIPENTVVEVVETAIADSVNYRYNSTAVTNGIGTTQITNGARFTVGEYGDPTVTINNDKIEYKNLKVKKTIDNSGTVDTSKVFKFYVEKKVNGSFVPFAEIDAAATHRNIHKGETVNIGDIEKGTEIRVTEIAPAYPYDFNTMTATGANITVNTDGKSGTLTLANSDVVVTIDNNQVPKKDFTVTKVMQSGSAALNSGDTFKIKIETARTTDGTSWTALANTAFTSSIAARNTEGQTDPSVIKTDGNGETTISKDEVLTFDDKVYQNEYIRVTEYTASLPADTSYVSVGATNLTDTDTQYSCTSVTNIQNYAGAYFKLVDNAAVTVTNYKTPRHNLTFTKNTDHTDTTTYFPVTVTVGGTQITSSNIDHYTFGGSVAPTSDGGDWYFDTTNNKFMVKKNGSVTIDSLLKGTAVNVVEDAVANYTYTANSSSVTGAANAVGTGTDPIIRVTGGFTNIKIGDNNVTVTIYNTVAKAGLTITKTIGDQVGDVIDDKGTQFHITIEKSTDGGSTWTPVESGLTWDHWDFDQSTRQSTWKTGETNNAVGTSHPKEYLINQGCQLSLPEMPVGTKVRVKETSWGSEYYNYDTMTLSNNATSTITDISDTTDPDNPVYGSVVTIGTTSDTLSINNKPIRETVVITKTTDYDLNDESKFYLNVTTRQFNGAGNLAANNSGQVRLKSTSTATAQDAQGTDAAITTGVYRVEKSGSVTFENIPRGTYFFITETTGTSPVTGEQRFTPGWLHVGDGDTNQFNTSWQAKAATKGGQVDVEVYNKIKRNDLKIAKNIKESIDTETKHTITVTAKKDSATGAAYSDFFYTVSKQVNGSTVTGSMQHYEAGAAIQFVQGEVLSFYVDDEGTKFPVGTYFTVKETAPGDTYVFDSFSHAGVTVTAEPDATHPAEITFWTMDMSVDVNLTVVNKLDTILYQIRYEFPSRPYLIGANAGNPQYGTLAYTTEVTTAQKDETIETVSGVERIKKSVLQANEPYEKNFLQSMTFDYDNATYSTDTSGVKKIYKATVKATGGTLPTKSIEFFFPYAVKKTTVTSEAGETITGLYGINYYFEPTVDTPELGNAFQSAQVLSEGVPYQSNPIITKTKVVEVTNDEGQTEDQTITQRFGTTAARTAGGKNFLYWSIRSKNKNIAKDNNAYQYVEVARCYEPQFNYTVFDDYKVYAIYEGGPGSDSAAHDKDTDKYTTINFLDYSRNNWTGDDKGGYPYNNGDVVWTDFDVAYENGYVELAATSDKTEIGILVEKVQDDLDKDSENKDISMDPTADNYANNYAHYAAKEENRTAVETFLKTTAASEKDANNNLKYSRKVINKSDLTNKGRTEYGYGLFVENNKVVDGVKKNALYRAYSYIKVTKDGETSIILCETPVYFSVKHEANK